MSVSLHTISNGDLIHVDFFVFNHLYQFTQTALKFLGKVVFSIEFELINSGT